MIDIHKHWCDYAGHEWDCSGTAIRLMGTEPTPCFCLTHGLDMEDGDHSECRIELVPCPEHRDAQLAAMGYATGQQSHASPATTPDDTMFHDAAGNPIMGFCLWCNRDFCSMEEHEAHVENDMAKCRVFQELKGEQCMPPVIAQILLRYEEQHRDDIEEAT